VEAKLSECAAVLTTEQFSISKKQHQQRRVLVKEYLLAQGLLLCNCKVSDTSASALALLYCIAGWGGSAEKAFDR
jgi:hypothetical protein